MASLEDENAAALARIVKRAKLEKRQLPRLIKNLDADLKAKKMVKDQERERDEKKTGKLIKLVKDCEDVAKFFLKEQKVFAEIKQPAANLIKAPPLKVGASSEAYLALAVLARVFLLKLSKLEPPQGKKSA